ncbi:MAG TPA: quinone-dependent dihydroorotate dehydrogenase [Dongiaceae bacterium]|nr:quinone-dependent dihydroorotate dehydrogenase [Dongiaceae bacterium]
MTAYRRLLWPLLRRLPPEAAHELARLVLPWWPAASVAPDPALRQTLWGLDFTHPIGLAAGFDKRADLFPALKRLGFSFVESGTITPLAQRGNPRPRLFRDDHARAIINRMGFNNPGIETAARHLARRKTGIVGINLGKNRDSRDALGDYREGARRLGPLASYVTINVSSPNTPGLRDLQKAAYLRELSLALRPLLAGIPLLVKLTPDLDPGPLADIAALARQKFYDGIILGNTTLARPPGLALDFAAREGGLSGRPLFDAMIEKLRLLRMASGGETVLIASGGIMNGEDAYLAIRAGAHLCQIYSALIFEGPGIVAAMAATLAKCLRRDGFTHLSAAVGADVRPASR